MCNRHYPMTNFRNITTIFSTTRGILMYVAAWRVPIICCFSAPGPSSILFWPSWEKPQPSTVITNASINTWVNQTHRPGIRTFLQHPFLIQNCSSVTYQQCCLYNPLIDTSIRCVSNTIYPTRITHLQQCPQRHHLSTMNHALIWKSVVHSLDSLR